MKSLPESRDCWVGDHDGLEMKPSIGKITVPENKHFIDQGKA